jgi:hypothetical protein
MKFLLESSRYTTVRIPNLESNAISKRLDEAKAGLLKTPR